MRKGILFPLCIFLMIASVNHEIVIEDNVIGAVDNISEKSRQQSRQCKQPTLQLQVILQLP